MDFKVGDLVEVTFTPIGKRKEITRVAKVAYNTMYVCSVDLLEPLEYKGNQAWRNRSRVNVLRENISPLKDTPINEYL